ncbi:hypothetical protein [Pediococcus ethanolidurans]|uniref:Bacteriophage minor capsid protein n=1 Tax=Pediococcus ethanolidurans TaxID=319653 RepID=A0A0R2JZX5_9LACO|nr:hypothetical protein [Pediococcus ethanolidurans]KRN82896.1 hypothetical protein IV87_GL001850 [Pediococcus ethanolidurans]GEN94689.1 hypothetical protein PET01_07390 [Pediococcus ethanolidurans]SER17614.1 bacteriophage minor capsid protein [Pediococcus ethanolidurans]
MDTVPTDLLESLFKVIKQSPDVASIPIKMDFPQTGESLGLQKLPNEQIISQDMMGYIQKSIGYELTYKTQSNGIPLLRKVAVFLSENFDKIQSLNGSFTLLTDPQLTEPEMNAMDNDYRYYAFDIAVEIETNY